MSKNKPKAFEFKVPEQCGCCGAINNDTDNVNWEIGTIIYNGGSYKDHVCPSCAEKFIIDPSKLKTKDDIIKHLEKLKELGYM